MLGNEYMQPRGCVATDVADGGPDSVSAEVRERSELAERVMRLKAAAVEACQSRERLPQPLF